MPLLQLCLANQLSQVLLAIAVHMMHLSWKTLTCYTQNMVFIYCYI